MLPEVANRSATVLQLLATVRYPTIYSRHHRASKSYPTGSPSPVGPPRGLSFLGFWFGFLTMARTKGGQVEMARGGALSRVRPDGMHGKHSLWPRECQIILNHRH